MKSNKEIVYFATGKEKSISGNVRFECENSRKSAYDDLLRNRHVNFRN